jgi:hypothetical protein
MAANETEQNRTALEISLQSAKFAKSYATECALRNNFGVNILLAPGLVGSGMELEVPDASCGRAGGTRSAPRVPIAVPPRRPAAPPGDLSLT